PNGHRAMSECRILNCKRIKLGLHDRQAQCKSKFVSHSSRVIREKHRLDRDRRGATRRAVNTWTCAGDLPTYLYSRELFFLCHNRGGEDFFVQSLAATAVGPNGVRNAAKRGSTRIVAVLMEDVRIAVVP